LPQIVIFGEVSYKVDKETDTLLFLEKLLKSTVLPKTAALYPLLYDPISKSIIATETEILIIYPSTKVSVTFCRAKVAANKYPDGRIIVIEVPLIGNVIHSLVEVSGLLRVIKASISWTGLLQCINATGPIFLLRRSNIFNKAGLLEILRFWLRAF